MRVFNVWLLLIPYSFAGIKQNSHSERILCNRMETQTWLSRHYKFILAENIIILSISSDDFIHAFLEVDKTESIVIFSAEINL